MVWAGIMMDVRTDLHFFDSGSVTAQRYRDEVLEPYVRLFRGAAGPDFISMDDNAPCHRVVLIDDFLETEKIERMSWPANSPDLNHIEHVWDMLGRQIAALSHPPNSITELNRALQEAWNRLSPQLIHHLIASMFHRSFTTGEKKIQYVSNKKRRKGATVSKNASWPSGVMIWTEMSSEGLTKPFFVELNFTIDA
ncbi:transposable element Tcb2 transposase [Trichonephila clavipes]|nr:transposable element Tcb2 transposase [Trichonephila clavipes]